MGFSSRRGSVLFGAHELGLRRDYRFFADLEADFFAAGLDDFAGAFLAGLAAGFGRGLAFAGFFDGLEAALTDFFAGGLALAGTRASAAGVGAFAGLAGAGAGFLAAGGCAISG